MNKFKELGINDELARAIEDLGFETPSEVQEKSIPILIEKDVDIVSLAQTGTGKTAAFGLPLIQKLDISKKETQALILSPTRELCLQISEELKKYSKYIKGIRVVSIYGGANINEQAKDIKRGAHIIVATPGRMLDMVKRKYLDISKIRYNVLDEADEMLNMGFKEDIDSILSETPKDKCTWLFSATMPREVARIAANYMSSPIEITVGSKNQGAKNISHQYYMVSSSNKYLALKRIVDFYPDIFGLIFCRTKAETQIITERLIQDGYNVSSLHGDLTQNQRDAVMKTFRSKQIQILVATDVAARGIDVDDISHVINYQLPDEPEVYTHRSGRTARAGRNGLSISIITSKDKHKIKTIERIAKSTFEQLQVPKGEEICEKQLFSIVKKVHDTEVQEEQIAKFLPKIEKELEHMSKEDIIKKFVSMEFNIFLKYYKNTRDLNDYADEHSSGTKRIFINIGEKDGFQWDSLKDFLKENLELFNNEISGVDVKEKFSFFNIVDDKSEYVIERLNGLDINGRSLSAEISLKRKGFGPSGGRGRSFNSRNRGFDSGNRRNDDYKRPRSGGGGFKSRYNRNRD
ncbi:DEAD/DEAH box helicase [Ichthyobacterium seriolicida]|uniref:DEAD/DEAH box helicase n=1 Tax=Ichthyobacterium seriolicida TaxID=242600 RepID=A0A1J1DWE7_9FLAO|nr:DEAD/DEAH box helicase [Ichthyobacterium seriolicida]BAV94191.1 DEAD/DEAH box helicase [Ichthyobacterium seriolicida]